MPVRFEAVIHATGFSVPVEEGHPIRGFYTVRRVMAADRAEAKAQALATLLKEPGIVDLMIRIREEGQHGACRFDVERCEPLSWWKRLFAKPSTGLIFYSDAEDEAE